MIRPGIPHHIVIAGPTDQRVIAGSANQAVIPAAAAQQVIAALSEQEDRGAMGAGIQRVIAGIAVDPLQPAPMGQVQRDIRFQIDLRAIIACGARIRHPVQRIDHIEIRAVLPIHLVGPDPADQRIVALTAQDRVIAIHA